MDDSKDITDLREQYTYYSKRLLSDLGLGDLQQPERGQLLAALDGYIQQVMINCLLENVTEEGVDDADKLMDEGGAQEEVLARLISSIPNAEIVIADRLAQTYAQILEETRQLASAITKVNSSAPITSTDSEQISSELSPADQPEDAPLAPPPPADSQS